MSNTHQGNIQPSIDAEEHAQISGVNLKKVAIIDDSGNQITNFGSATEYDVNDAAPANPSGSTLLMERDDVLSTLNEIEGDWTNLRGTAEGALWTQDFNSDAILADTANMDTNLGSIAGAVSGNEMQVDIVAITPDLMLGTDFSNVFGTASLVDGSNHIQVDIAADSVGIGGGTEATDDTTTHATGSTKGKTMMAVATPTDGTVDVNDIGALAMSTDRRLHTDAQIVGQDADITIADGGNIITVDGTITANLSAADNAVLDDIAANQTDATQKTQIVDGAGAVIGSTSNALDVNIASGSSSGTEYTEDAVAPANPAASALSLVRDDALSAQTSADGDIVTARGTDKGEIYVKHADDITIADGGNTITVDGTVTANLGATDNAVLDQIEVNTSYGDNTGGGTETGALRVTIANNSTGVLSIDDNSGSITVDNAGLTELAGAIDTEVQVDIVSPGTAAGSLGKAEDAAHSSGDVGVMALGVRDTDPAAVSGTDGDYEPSHINDDGGMWVTATPSHTGGNSFFSSIDLDESEEQVSGTACTVSYMYFWNATAAPLWVQIFNNTAASIAPGTDAPDINFPIPANADSDVAGVTIPIPQGGIGFGTALSVAVTTGSGTNSGAPGANDAGAIIFYKN